VKAVKHLVEITTNASKGCEECDSVLSGVENFAGAVNHYLQVHGYRLIHLGSQTSHDYQGNPWQSTIAVLGTDKAPKRKKKKGG